MSLTYVNTTTESGLQISQISGVQDDTWSWTIPTDISPLEIAAVSVFVEGTVLQQRTAGTPSQYYKGAYERTAGTCGFEYATPLITAGTLSYTVTSPTFKYYCLTDTKNRYLNPVAYRPKNGETIDIPQGKIAFIAMGQVSFNGTIYNSPAYIEFINAGGTLTATADSLVVQIDILN
jgi:hypothetical protein